MRDANWDEIFQRRSDEATATSETGLRSIIPWEDWLTFLITCVTFLSVVQSIDGAGWVEDMPSLYPIAFSAIVAGYALSRLRVHELLIHPIALLIGATLIFFQLMVLVPGGSLVVRTDALLDRMYEWWAAVTQSGISNDELPFIVLVLILMWLGTYASTWSIFRWRNPWLALVPGGTALMWNISYIPGQFHVAFVFFLFGAVLLIMRLHLSHKEDEWDRQGVRYPEFISLSVLHVTFWVTVGLLIAVWIIPLAERSDSARSRWDDFTQPYRDALSPLARGFVAVDSKRPINVHNLQDALPFQGEIHLSGRDAVEVTGEIPPEAAAFLRGQSFDEYTAEGWKVNVEDDNRLRPGERIDPLPSAEGARQETTVDVTVQGEDNDELLYSVGQPVETDRRATAEIGADPSDVTSLRPRDDLDEGDTYSVTGSVAVASAEQLRAAGTDYPAWVTDTYLALPDDLPERVGEKAVEVTDGAATPYDQAAAIEQYLRAFPNEFDVPETPPGRDTVDFFLFDLKRGYFDYHASAMAVLLRTLGVPARVSSGYVLDPGQQEEGSDLFSLTERNAFAWPEVYFPGAGWVEFNPTPSQPTVPRPGAFTPADDPSQIFDIPDDILRGDPGAELIPEGSTGSPPTPAAGEGGGGSNVWPWLIALAAAGGVIALATAGGRFVWEYGLGGMPRPAQLWEKTARLASLGKAGPRRNETPREFASRLRAGVPGTDDVAYLAATYERSRFGQKPTSDDEAERLESAWASVRNRLLERVLRRR